MTDIELPVLLIVEDDEGLQRQLKWAYEGYRVVIAGNRAQAIELVRLHEPKVVTLDLGLPPDPDGTTEFFAFDDPICTNICFGGADMRDAWITASMSDRLFKTRWPRPGLKLNFNA